MKKIFYMIFIFMIIYLMSSTVILADTGAVINAEENLSKISNTISVPEGIVMNFYTGEQYIYVPVDALKSFEIIPNESSRNLNNNEQFTGDVYAVELCPTYINVYENGHYKSLINTFSYNYEYYCNIKDISEHFNISYSWDKDNSMAHLKYKDKDTYMKCYRTFNLYGTYSENSDVPVVNDRPDSVNTDTEGKCIVYRYYYKYNDYEIFKKNGLYFASNLFNNGFDLVNTDEFHGTITNFFRKKIGNEVKSVNYSVQYEKLINSWEIAVRIYY